RLRALQIRRALRRLEHRVTLVELHLLLREVRGHDTVPQALASGCRLAPVENRLQQRRLARPVRADERDVLAALDRQGDVTKQRSAGHADLQGFSLEDGATAARRIDEPET